MSRQNNSLITEISHAKKDTHFEEMAEEKTHEIARSCSICYYLFILLFFSTIAK